ncbi:MAG: hypothetical protein ACJAXJ_002813 [Colwellia sp.]|jgi:hypothetical protein
MYPKVFEKRDVVLKHSRELTKPTLSYQVYFECCMVWRVSKELKISNI